MEYTYDVCCGMFVSTFNLFITNICEFNFVIIKCYTWYVCVYNGVLWLLTKINIFIAHRSQYSESLKIDIYWDGKLTFRNGLSN